MRPEPRPEQVSGPREVWCTHKPRLTGQRVMSLAAADERARRTFTPRSEAGLKPHIFARVAYPPCAHPDARVRSWRVRRCALEVMGDLSKKRGGKKYAHFATKVSPPMTALHLHTATPDDRTMESEATSVASSSSSGSCSGHGINPERRRRLA